MRTVENTTSYPGQDRLAIISGWSPQHRSLETQAAELVDMIERDAAARNAFSRAGRAAR